jgi:hypothetical protein
MKDPYLKPGRLADVIAAIQVMSAAKRPERKIEDWANEFSRSRDPKTVSHWSSLFEEHREFFLTYKLKDEPKAALRLRYAFKTYDAETGKEYTPEEIKGLSREERDLLTTKPLSGDHIGTLINTAIGLHTRALEQQSARRWWVPLLAAGFGFAGAIVGTFLSALIGLRK